MSDSAARPERRLRDEAVREANALEVSGDAPGAVPRQCRLVVEDVLVVDVEDVGVYALMWTPTGARDLAVGFALTEGLISSLDDILTLSDCEADPGVVRMRLARPPRVPRSDAVPARLSSCGMCGSRTDVEAFLSAPPRVRDTLRIPVETLPRLAEEMRSRQSLFRRTGGTHAAAIIDGAGMLIALGEDIGRHNALDKAVGACLLKGQPTSGCGVVLSGRASFELVAKSARAGIELVAAVSAPSSLAVEAAEKCNVTLCAFVREDRATIYTHPHRVVPGHGG